MREEIIVRSDGTKRVMYHFDDPSLTRQDFKDSCDISFMTAQYLNSPEGREQIALAQDYVRQRFEDVSQVSDLRTALEAINNAEKAFMRLPPHIRSRFDNDAVSFVEFIDDPLNIEECIKLGLVKAPEPPNMAASTDVKPKA